MDGWSQFSLALGYLSAVLKKSGHVVDLMDFNCEDFSCEFLWKKVSRSLGFYNCLGVSFSSCPGFRQFGEVLSALELIKNFITIFL